MKKKIIKKVGHFQKDYEIELFKLKNFLTINYPEILNEFEDEIKVEKVIYG